MLYRCDSCGSSMVYDPDQKALVCAQCGRTQETMSQAATMAGQGTCPNCGAAFEGAERRLVYQCPYCSSWMTVEENISAPNAPKKITPFAFGKQKARETIRQAFDRIPFLPDSFLQDPEGKDIEALYAPFWLYEASGQGEYDYRGERQHTRSHGSSTTTYHDVYDIHRSVRAVFHEVPVDAMDSLEDRTIDAALPFEKDLEKDLDPIYLAGTNAYLPDKDAKEQEYRKRAHDWALESLDEKEPGLTKGYVALKKKKRERSVTLEEDAVSGVLLPVYRYEYKGFGNHKIYMNGTTGRMSGDAPCDRGKVLVHYLVEAACVIVSAAALVGIMGVLR